MEKPLVRTAWTLILSNNRILLYKRKNTWYENGNYGLPGGVVDEGETPELAAVRETKEETSVLIDTSTLELLRVVPFEYTDKIYHNHYFRAHTWSGVPVNTEADRCDDLSWFSNNDLPNNMIPIVRDIIKTTI